MNYYEATIVFIVFGRFGSHGAADTMGAYG